MLGHNNPPDEFARVTELVQNADRWLEERKIIETDEIAERATAFLGQLREEAKDIEKARKAEKAPHIEAGKAVDQKFGTQTERLRVSAEAIKDLLTPYLEKKEAERLEAERKLREEAEAAERNARAAAERAKGIDAQLAAAAASQHAAEIQKAADQQAKARTNIASGMGGRAVSLRVKRSAVIVDQGKVYRKFRDHPEVIAVLQKLADAEVRAKRNVPGVEVRETKSAA